MAHSAPASSEPSNNDCPMHERYNMTCGTCNGLFDKQGNPTPQPDNCPTCGLNIQYRIAPAHGCPDDWHPTQAQEVAVQPDKKDHGHDYLMKEEGRCIVCDSRISKAAVQPDSSEVERPQHDGIPGSDRYDAMMNQWNAWADKMESLIREARREEVARLHTKVIPIKTISFSREWIFNYVDERLAQLTDTNSGGKL